MIEGLTEGRIVHFVTESGKHRPAIVVQVWSKDTGCSNLQVFLDGTNDRADKFSLEQMNQGTSWKTSVTYSEEPKPNTWHYPERP